MLEITPEVYFFTKKIASTPNPFEKYETEEEEPAASKPTVLVVDDQQMIADTTKEVLKRLGFKAVSTYSGDSALQIAAKMKPDYLLTDVLMPGMNGVELAIMIKNQMPATRIVLFSGQAGITDIMAKARADGYNFELLAKPIHPEKLVEHLRRKI